MASAARAERRRRARFERKSRDRATPVVKRDRGRPIPTRWNGEPCAARRCIVDVEDFGRRNAVEVVYNGHTFYIDDEPYQRFDDEIAALKALRAALPPAQAAQVSLDRDAGYHGWGWAKVTHGRGSPRYGHRELRGVSVVHYHDPEPDPESGR